MKSKGRIAAIVTVVALVIGLMAGVLAASVGANPATVSLDASYYKSSVKPVVTVVEASANTPGVGLVAINGPAHSSAPQARCGGSGAFTACEDFGSSNITFANPNESTVQGGTSDLVFNLSTITSEAIHATSKPLQGLVRITCTAGACTGISTTGGVVLAGGSAKVDGMFSNFKTATSIRVEYNFGKKDVITVKYITTSNSTGIDQILTETTVDSGTFTNAERTQTDKFSGDGSQTLFNLTKQQVNPTGGTNPGITDGIVAKVGSNTLTQVAVTATPGSTEYRFDGTSFNRILFGVAPTSGTDNVEITYVMDTGKVKISTSNSSAPTEGDKLILGVDGDKIKVTYGSDTSTESTIDTVKPVITVVRPVAGTATKDTKPVFEVDVTDARAGITTTPATVLSADDITYNVCSTSTNADNCTSGVSGYADSNLATGNLTSLAGGWKLTYQSTTALADGDYWWVVTAEDRAGNTQTTVTGTGSSSTSVKLTVDNTAPAIDPASSFANTGTGYYWDSVTSTEKTNKLTSLRTRFTELLDSASVSASDFEINDATPSAIALMDKEDPTSGNTPGPCGTTTGKKCTDVYLEWTNTSTSATPKLEIVSDILDKLGNKVSSFTLSAVSDRIAPTVTVDADVTSAKNTQKIKLTITVSETSSTPALTLTPTATTGVSYSTISAPSVALKTGETKVYEAEWTVAVTSTGQGTPAASAEVVASFTATDSPAGNAATAVTKKLQIDNAGPAISITPTGTVNVSNPRITVTITDTGEYTNDSLKDVTVSVLKLDGVDVSTTAFKKSSTEWVIATSGLAVGDHTVEVKAADSLANSTDKTGSNKFTFTVAAVGELSITLEPDWNLISVPRALTDPGIGQVFADITKVSSIFTFDGATQTWQWARYDATAGTWDVTGGLTTIEAGKGYYVNASDFVTLKVTPSAGTIGAGASPVSPPSYPVAVGWNLIGYVTLDAANPSVTAGTYLAALSTNWTSLYSYSPDPTVGFQRIVTGAEVDVKKGYWLYATKVGTITP